MPPFHHEENSLYRHVLANTIDNRSNSSRTQHKLQLQRLSFLTNDKNYLDHPQNMRRLTRELDRVDREYRNVRRYEDPLKQSLKRLQQQKSITTSIAVDLDSTSTISSTSSSSSSSSLNSNYSTTTDKTNFLSRWFNDITPSKEITSNHSSMNHDACANSVAYSFHPTIAHHMKQQRRAAKH